MPDHAIISVTSDTVAVFGIMCFAARRNIEDAIPDVFLTTLGSCFLRSLFLVNEPILIAWPAYCAVLVLGMRFFVRVSWSVGAIGAGVFIAWHAAPEVTRAMAGW